MISAKILCDSFSRSAETRLTTFELTYPRFIHSELMTHRALSKNSASSRAIPLKRMIANIEEQTALPEYWGAEQKGMQSGEELSNEDADTAALHWNAAARDAIEHARRLGIKIHKSIANRLLEPFAHMTVILTGETKGLQHFFALRAHPAAQPEFQVLAYRMLDAWMKSKPALLAAGEWHLPMVELGLPIDKALKVSTGRIARVSYLTHDGRRDYLEDIALHDRLISAEPAHMSPFEHCAKLVTTRLGDREAGNFGRHWLQYRKCLDNEVTRSFDAAAAMARKPDWISL